MVPFIAFFGDILSVMSVNGTFLTDTFTKSDGSVITNFPILDTSQDYINFISWEMAAFGLAYVCNVAQRPAEVDDTAGPKGALAMLIILPVVMLLFYFLWNALRSLFDLRYYYAHAITTAAFVLSSMYASRYVRKRMRRSSTEKTTAKKAHSRVLSSFVTIVTLLSFIIYFFFVLPFYFSSSAIARMVVCLVVLACYEVNEVICWLT